GSSYLLSPLEAAAVELGYGGSPVAAGQFDQYGAWVPIGAEQTASGYEVAWKVTGADQYQVWQTDSSGNFLSTGGVVSGSSTALQSIETSFQQDLNGDGLIGGSSNPPPGITPPAMITVLEDFGSTGLAQVGSSYLLSPLEAAAVELGYGGSPVAAGQF